MRLQAEGSSLFCWTSVILKFFQTAVVSYRRPLSTGPHLHTVISVNNNTHKKKCISFFFIHLKVVSVKQSLLLSGFAPPFWTGNPAVFWGRGSGAICCTFLNKSNRRVQICHKTELWWIQLNPAEDNSAKLITPEPIWIIDEMSNPACLRSCAHCQSFGEDRTPGYCGGVFIIMLLICCFGPAF